MLSNMFAIDLSRENFPVCVLREFFVSIVFIVVIFFFHVFLFVTNIVFVFFFFNLIFMVKTRKRSHINTD